MKKIDWTKPLLHNSLTKTVDATYHGPTKDVRTPYLVSAEISPGEVRIDLVDHFGRDCFGAQIVANAPEPKTVYRDVWVNIYPPAPLTGEPLHGYAHPSRKSADKAFGTDRRIACIRLPDFVEGEGL